MDNGRIVFRAAILFTLFSFLVGDPLHLFAASDITSLASLEKSLLRYDRKTKTSYFDVAVKNISNAPILTPVRVIIAGITPAQVVLANPDGQTTTGKPFYEYTLPAGQLLPGESTAAKRWTFSNPGQLRFTFTLERIESLTNVPPLADAGDDAEYTLAAGQTQLSVTLDGSTSIDPDGNIAGYSWSGSPDPADVVAPTINLPAGIHTFTLVVRDGEGAESIPDMVRITVHEPPNMPPVAHAGQNATYTLAPGQSAINVLLDGTASTDQDGEITTYAWSGSPTPQSIAQPSVSLSAGTYTFTLIVTDNDGAQSDPASVSITVRPATISEDHPPVLSVNPRSYSIVERQTLAFTVSGTDPDGQVVTLSAQPLIDNSTFAMTAGTQATGTFTFTPGYSQQGIHVVSFKARDSRGFSDTKSVEIRVTNVNQAPLISVASAIEVAEGALVTIPIEASDPDGDNLSLSVDNLPANAIFIPATATITFTPDFTQAGDYDLVCKANDGEYIVQSLLRITVKDVATDEPGQARELVLTVNPVESPTFVGTVRITGTVNPTGEEPSPARMKSALITAMHPTTATQGQTLDVELVSDTSQLYSTHFAQGLSQASFGEGIRVNAITVTSPTRALVNLSVAADADPGPRHVVVVSDNETALGVNAFTVRKGLALVTGVLIDLDTGNPIVGAIVSIEGTDITTTTNGDGSFSFASAPTGTYRLIINAQDHELIYQEVHPVAGSTTNIGKIASPATVYAPGAAPAQSIQGVLARGIGDTVGHTNREMVKQAIRDTLLLIAGNEVGLLDEYGNQLNPNARDGQGYYSLTDEGVRILADQMMRGDSMALVDLLFAIEISFQRTQGAMASLEEWLTTLQAAIDRAWADPTNPDSLYALVMFGKGRTLQPTAPQLSPHTRLTSLQAHVFMTSILTYIFTRDDPTWGSPSRFWRINEGIGRVSHLRRIIDTAVMNYTSFIVGVCTMPTFTRLAMAGRLAVDLMGAFGVVNLDAYIPVEPVLRKLDTAPGANGWEKVVATFNRSTTDLGSGRLLYSLWRFDSANDTRTLVNSVLASELPQELRVAVIEDPNPPGGTYFYAMTITRLLAAVDSIPLNQLENAAPFWQSYAYDMPDAMNLYRTTHQLVSNYSNPIVVTVGDPAARTAIAELEVNSEGVVYYLTGEKRVISTITEEGAGICTPFIDTSFAAPGAEGLAIDAEGNLYTENAASDMRFGGRIFKIFTPGGERVFTGTLNYYSQLIDFAQPTDAGPMAVAADNTLLVVDRLSREVKKVDVNAAYDPIRRVGQRYAKIPDEAVGHAFDMEVDPEGNVYLLYMGLSTPPTAGITFGPSQYLDVPKDYNDVKNGYVPQRPDGLITEYGKTRVSINVLVMDSQSRPIPDTQVNFASDVGTFLLPSTTTNSDGIATGIIEVHFTDHTTPHAQVEVRAVVPVLSQTFTRAISVVNNLQNILDEYRRIIPRGPLIENNTYYTSGQAAEVVGRLTGVAPAGKFVKVLGLFGTYLSTSILGPGAFNNIASTVADEPDNYVCQAYQRKVLEFLNSTREKQGYLLNGLDYGPTMALGIIHKNAVIWDSLAPNGYKDGLFLDPWISQAPEVYDYATVRMQWLNLLDLSAPRPDYDSYGGIYPLTAGRYYPSIEFPAEQPPPKPVTGVVIATDEPVKVEIIDSQGKSTGFDESSTFKGEKDGMWYFKPKDDITMLTLPDSLPYDLRIRADAQGLATVALLFENGQELRYPEFTLPAGSTSSLRVDSANREQSIVTNNGPVPPAINTFQPAIQGISPGTAKRGETLTVALTGNHTNFVNGVSQAMAAQGITVSNLTVTGLTAARATITVGSDVNPGKYIVTVLTNTEFAVPMVSLEVREDD